jgi:hypothetical protein
MLKGKNLWIALGVGAVAYYLFMQNKKNKAAKVVSAPVNFTGDLDVPAYQNANGDTTRKKSDTTISGSSPFKHVVLKGNKPKN